MVCTGSNRRLALRAGANRNDCLALPRKALDVTHAKRYSLASMSSDQSVILQGLLTRWLAGAESARLEMIRCAYERLRRLAAVILNQRFPRLKTTPALLETTDAV